MAFFALLIVIRLYSCYSASYNAVIGNATMPRINDAMAVAYNANNDEILLIGGDNGGSRQFMKFKDNTFIDLGADYLSYFAETLGFAQYFTSIHDTLWMIHKSGDYLIVFDIETEPTAPPIINISTNVGNMACLASIETHIIVVGGGIAFESAPMSMVQIYDINGNVWFESVPTLGTPRGGHSCLVVNDALYAIGGTDGNELLSSIEQLNISNIASISSKEWLYLPGTLNIASWATRAVHYGTDIIVVGGQDVTNQRLSDVNLIDTLSGNCELRGTLAFGTSYAASIVVRNVLYIFAGYTNDGASDQYQYIIFPTSDPTETPTSEPTKIPSDHPTIFPTKMPSDHPTIFPTKIPSDNPTTTIPSYTMPTNHPTQSPTSSPTSPPGISGNNTKNTINVKYIIFILIAIILICLCILVRLFRTKKHQQQETMKSITPKEHDDAINNIPTSKPEHTATVVAVLSEVELQIEEEEELMYVDYNNAPKATGSLEEGTKRQSITKERMHEKFENESHETQVMTQRIINDKIERKIILTEPNNDECVTKNNEENVVWKNSKKVELWLSNIKLEQYTNAFMDRFGSNLTEIWNLNENDLMEMGILDCNHRKTIAEHLKRREGDIMDIGNTIADV